MPPVKSKKGASPPPKPKPRATMKLGVLAHAYARTAKYQAESGATKAARAGAMVVGAALAAIWLGGMVDDIWVATEKSSAQFARTLGFGVERIEVIGASGNREREARAALLLEEKPVMFGLALNDMRDRLTALDWVRDARVYRQWPSRLVIDLSTRDPIVRWQENGRVVLADANGEKLTGMDPMKRPDLLQVVGVGAGPKAAELLHALEPYPELRERTIAAIYVGERRWNLRLKSGADLALPQKEISQALERANRFQAQTGLLDQPLSRVDFRQPDRVYVLPRTGA